MATLQSSRAEPSKRVFSTFGSGLRTLPSNLREDEALHTGAGEEARIPSESVDLIPDIRNPDSALGMDEFP